MTHQNLSTRSIQDKSHTLFGGFWLSFLCKTCSIIPPVLPTAKNTHNSLNIISCAYQWNCREISRSIKNLPNKPSSASPKKVMIHRLHDTHDWGTGSIQMTETGHPDQKKARFTCQIARYCNAGSWLLVSICYGFLILQKSIWLLKFDTQQQSKGELKG